jgi:cholesterol oxidase
MTKHDHPALTGQRRQPLRALRLPAPEAHYVTTEDGVTLKLVRYAGGQAGPVVFAPGNGITNEIALLDSVACNLTEYLVERGHDVWLLDWRASPEVGCAGYSLNDAARYDWPAALGFVTRHTGAASVDCVTFCAGGMTLLMAQAAGYLGGMVRSAVCLQSSLYISAAWPARLKGAVRLAEIVGALGWRTYRQDASGASWPYRLLDAVLKLHPVPKGEQCSSPSCRRMVFGYGPYVRHAQLNPQTHDLLPGILGAASSRSFSELGGACRTGALARVDAAALDNLNLPITFIHGDENRLLLPQSSARLYVALVARHGEGLHARVVTPGYGHFDCLAGEHAARDVFPSIGAHLDRTAA